MQYQIVFLSIGEKQCGDAILVRYGELDSGDPDKQTVVLIDGGYKSDWQKVVNTVIDRFKLSKIDLAVSTHLDGDHIAGMPGVLENITVDHLWMHLPWEHSGDFLAARQVDFSSSGYTMKLEKSLQGSSDLAAAADNVGLSPEEPFTGQQFISSYGTLTVLGPSPVYYEQLLPQILDKSLSSAQAVQPSYLQQLIRDAHRGLQAAASVFESHRIETLTNNGDTSPSNNSSTVMLLELADGSKKLLFTGDAGIPALEMAAVEYANRGHLAGELKFVQVPHHGSRQNVGPDVLDQFLGQRTPNSDDHRGTAYVSVGKTCDNHGHPKKVATNAFKRRGYPVFQTRGTSINHGHPLTGYTEDVMPLPLYGMVEPDE